MLLGNGFGCSTVGFSARLLVFLLIFLPVSPVLAVATVAIDNFNHSGTIQVSTDSGDLFNVRAVDPASLENIDPDMFPVGLVYFEVTAVSANVQVTFSGIDNSQARYYKFVSAFPGEAPALRDFSSRSQPQGTGWVLHLREGGFGDSTGNDHLIVDPGGPRLAAAPPPPPGVEPEPVPLTPGWLALLSLLLMAVAVLNVKGRCHE
ncbi:hypothetical protein [Thiolapillus brandeum]|uniref:IPTL-CTERM sorting domain-containing protein n=1 Tax=Thiolapillus brandeum TaxID=1076588 RepID=A0A7U6GJ39_9GAMM|nr:hypothetical protein [Thiolapillus brandeum]BAO44518.1 hypothetical protein TBH_C1601 [Thiolapillus brandeum]